MEDKFKFWKEVWDKKGDSDSDDLLFLDGYEHLNIDFDSKKIVEAIQATLGIKKDDRVLEVGCGAGFLGRDFDKICLYQGIDYSAGLLNKHYERYKTVVYCCEADRLFYPDKSFDYALCFGVFQYFPDFEYALRVVREMKRVSRKKVFLGDLKKSSENKKHMSYTEENFFSIGDCEFVPCLYDPKDTNRFNVVIK